MKTQETPQLTPLQKTAVGRKLIEAEIISRAWASGDFRKKLEENPSAALAEAGLPMPKNKTIRIVNETTDTLIFVIPPAPLALEEIGETELEAVAGGGLIQNGTCESAKDFNEEINNGDAAGQARTFFRMYFGFLIAKSWGWG